ncbi:MAG: cytochrome C oxidase subunit IV family protein [Gemmatimonadaceae bacterium]|jgi:cytochrome c oxidase subunit 4|nr:cytochrome C oxidase subunit IV family protein [Gemmatimonadaceae bacterium]MDQ3520159.1 cytochrome C oxidase subunit IV family protein [Gemmatimonadota bacterium]
MEETKPTHEPAKHAHPNYVGIFVVLAVLTGVELGVAFLPWSKTVLVLLLLGLAVWKAVLVALYYMHLRFEPNRLRILAIAPLPLAVILVAAVITEFIW